MPAQQQHIFEQHLLGRINEGPLLKGIEEAYWPSLYLLISLALLVILKQRSPQRLLRVVQSTFSLQVLQQLGREDSNSMRAYASALNFFYIANFAFLLFKLNLFYGLVLPGVSHFSQFLFFGGLLGLLYLLRRMVNLLLGIVTAQGRLLSDYLSRSALLNQTFGLLLFPCIVLMEFSEIPAKGPLVAGLVIIAMSFLLRWYRGFVLGKLEGGIGILQIFSYFCGLEILPVLVMVKYLVETL